MDEHENDNISEDESLSPDSINNSHNDSSQRRINENIAILSPHRKHKIENLPILNDMDLDINENEIKKLIKDGGLLRESQHEILNKLQNDYNEIFKFGERSRTELNESIKGINDQYKELKTMTDKQYKQIMDRVNNKRNQNDDGDDDEKSEESEYKVLYETSMKKINALNNDMMGLRNNLRSKCEEISEINKKHEQEMIDLEELKKKENMELNRKYNREISDLELKLKCIETEYSEYKDGIIGKFKINENNQNLMIEKLKRENEALCMELSGYRGNARTATPNSRILSPAVPSVPSVATITNYNYDKHIRDSPLMERTRNELLQISKTKDLENNVLNLQQEIEGYKKQLIGKKELIKEFEGLLNENQNELKKYHTERKNMIIKLNDFKKIIDLYQILTSTKIEKRANNDNNGNIKEEFLCRTINKINNNAMLEYYLCLGPIDDNNNDKENMSKKKEIFCDYQLISSHNNKFNNNRFMEEENMTFHSNQAPLWLKGLLQEMFVNNK